MRTVLIYLPAIACSLEDQREPIAFEIPNGASIVEFSPHDPDVLYAAVLEAPEASVYVSKDGGDRWENL